MIEFRLLGFPVQIQSGFLFLVGIVVLFGLRSQDPIWYMAATVAVFLVSILVHELGHALMSRVFGVSVGTIVIHGFGGYVTHGKSSLGQGIAISLAGPFAGLALGAIAVGLYTIAQNEYAVLILQLTMFVNIFWSLFNLLPMFPLDGGHALLHALQLLIDPQLAAKITFGLGLVLGVLTAIAGWQMGLIFVAFFSGSFAYQNFQLLKQMRTVLPGSEEG